MQISERPRPWITLAVFTVIGASMLVGGVWLIAVGGSSYYLIAGVGLLLVAACGWWRSRWTLWLYALVLLGTAIWSLAEVGLDFWQLEPRLVMPIILGIWLLLTGAVLIVWFNP